MALDCPHIIWRIFPFNSTSQCFTRSFEYFNCSWRWEYSVHTKNDNEMPEEIVSIYLKRLTNSTICSLFKFSTTVSIKSSGGEYHAVRISNHDASPLVSWCVWKKPKSYILGHDVLENNSCFFSLTLEPIGYVKDLNYLSDNKSYDATGLQELISDFDKFMKCSKHADIILKCGNTEIKAHKDVLCFRSKKFADMLEVEDNFDKTSTDDVKRLLLPCLDPVVFVILLRYIYTATLPNLTNELTRRLYEVSDEYAVESLKKKCRLFIIEHLSDFDALELLLYANDHNDDDLKWAVSSFIACDLNILNSNEWKKFTKMNEKLAVDVFKVFAERVNNRASLDNYPSIISI